jgi:RNA polymerase sigma factor (sigma-70 family)
VVDDEANVRRAMKALLESVGLPVVTYPSAEAFLEAVDAEQIGCVLADLRMPGIGGIGLVQEIARGYPGLTAIAVTAYANVDLAVRMMRLDAIDVIEKPINDDVLLERVREALLVAREQYRASVERESIRERLEALTDREREVVDLLSSGLSIKQIAGQLGICRRTVEVHRSNAMDKMQVLSIAELVRHVMLHRDEDPRG